MPSVFESVTGLLAQGDTMSKLGGALGANTGTTQRAVETAAPALLVGMADRVEQPGGLAAVSKMLDAADRSPQASVDGMFGGDGKLGLGMLDGLFGADRGDLLSRLASNAGINSGMMGKLLPMIAPVIMGVVAKRRSADGLSGKGLTDLLTGERDQLSRSGLLGAGAAGAGAAGATAAAGVGATAASGAGAGAVRGGADRAAGRASTTLTERPNVPTPNKPSRGGFGWLRWLIGALVVVAVAAWALSQCGGGDELNDATGALGDAADDVTDAAEDAVDEGGDAAGDAADAAEDAVDDAADAVGDAEDAVDDAADEVVAVDLQPDVDAALAAAGVAGTAATVSDGVVTLTGEAESDDAKAAAEAAVAGVDGVTSVDNQIVVAAMEEAEDTEEAADDTAEADDTEEAAESGATINDLLDLDPITFAVNSAEITPEGQAVLANAVEFMNANADVNVEIGGHTDSDGDDAFNLELSQSRADSVKAFLEAEGIAGDRMTTKGYGEAEPKVDNDTDENKAINRRIEFTVQ